MLFISTSNITDQDGASIELVDIVEHYKSTGRHVNFVQPIYTSTLPKKQGYYDAHLPLIFQTPLPLDKNEKGQLREFLIYLSAQLDPDYLQMYDQYELFIGKIKYRTKQLEHLIEKAGCSYVICRSLYTNPWVIMASTNLGVKCIEMQHGVTTAATTYFQSPVAPDQLGKNTLLLPDYILTLGEEWSKVLFGQNYIYNSTNTFVIGTSLYDDAVRRTPNNEVVSGSEFRVLIATQLEGYSITGWLDEFLSSFVEDLIEAKIKIVIRSHPKEPVDHYREWENKYPLTVKHQSSSDVFSYDAISAADVLLSPTSMCLYEALAFGKPALSLKKFSGRTASKHVEFVETPEDFYKTLIEMSNGSGKAEKRAYLTGFRPDVLNEFLQDTSDNSKR